MHKGLKVDIFLLFLRVLRIFMKKMSYLCRKLITLAI